jgi:hypothetical protein
LQLARAKVRDLKHLFTPYRGYSSDVETAIQSLDAVHARLADPTADDEAAALQGLESLAARIRPYRDLAPSIVDDVLQRLQAIADILEPRRRGEVSL